MQCRRWRLYRWSLIGMSLLLWTSCSQLRLPAIDPSGRRIFLPPPASTSLTRDKVPLFPRPAYQAPPAPPPCDPQGLPPVAEEVAPEKKPKSLLPKDTLLSKLSAAPRYRLVGSQIQVNPPQQLARIGTPVTLIAGVCAEDGYLLRGEPMEWYLTPESVGDFVDVGSQTVGPLHGALSPLPRPHPDFALGMTATGPRILTRGTAQVTDDVWLLPGQSWLTITSNQAGTSRIMVLAPRDPDCEVNHQFATIEWIDVTWTFPPDAQTTAGDPIALVTQVRRQSNGEPLAGYTVLYDYLDGQSVTINGQSTSVAVQSDAQGNATVKVEPQQPAIGTARIRARVLRLGASPNEGPLAEQIINAHWIAPPLTVRMIGPNDATLGSEIDYVIEIANGAPVAAPNVVVTDRLPPGLELVSADPPPEPREDQLEWRIGTIPPGSKQEIRLRCRTTAPGGLRHCATVQGDGNSATDGCTTTQVITQVRPAALSIEATGPEQVDVGQRVVFHIVIRNQGDQPLDVTLRDEFDAGLEHFDPDSAGPKGTSPLERSLGTIGPGQETGVDISFTAREPGEWCHTVEASAGDVRASARDCVVVRDAAAAPQVGISVQHSGANGIAVGQTVRFRFQVTNTGNVPLTGVQVIDSIDRTLRAEGASHDAREHPDGIQWILGTLAPGAQQILEVECRGMSATNAACHRASVYSDQNATGRAEACVRIDEVPSVPPPDDPDGTLGNVPGPQPPASVPGTPQLLMQLQGEQNIVRVQDRYRYELRLRNNHAQSLHDVQVAIVLPPAIQFEQGSPGNPVRAVQRAGDATSGTIVDFEPLREVRAGETIRLAIDVEAGAAGQHTIRAEATAAGSAGRVATETQTLVRGN